MLPRNHPDRIQIAFDDHRLVANAGLLLPATLGPAPRPFPIGTAAPGPGRCAGPGQPRRQDNDAGRFRAGWRRLHRRRRCLARWRGGLRSRQRSQGAIHPGHLPAQLSLGPRPPTGLGEPRVAGPRLAGRSRTRRRAIYHRPRFHHLRDLPTNLRCHAVTAGADSPVSRLCTGRARA